MRSPAVVTALALAAAVGAACSSRPRPDAPGGGQVVTPPDEVAAAPDAAAPPAPLSRAECELLIDHILALSVQARVAEGHPEPHPDDLARVRAALLEEMLGQCLIWDRASYQCVIDASSTRPRRRVRRADAGSLRSP